MFKEDTGVSAETVEQLIRKKFPQIDLKVIKSAKGTLIEDVVSGGVVPDIVSYSLGGLWKLKDLQLLSDLTPLIQTHKFDLTRFADGVVDVVKSYSDNGQQFLVMPFELNNNALFYNKDIFDRAGVDYPKDGMTWEQLYDLTRRLVRTDGNVQINGFHYNFLNVIYKNQLALPFVDP
ncbi:MAG: family 1 extracellular solute-binding protein, partial [Paenibacillus sp.]|nr:family 1 extracellular solute-binding protein [Paenibacillus sp.]